MKNGCNLQFPVRTTEQNAAVKQIKIFENELAEHEKPNS